MARQDMCHTHLAFAGACYHYHYFITVIITNTMLIVVISGDLSSFYYRYY